MISQAVYADPQLLVAKVTRPPGLKFTGEIDWSNVQSVSHAVHSYVTARGDLHLDLNDLLFCDVSGIRALIALAEGLPRGRRLILHGLPPQLETVLDLVGWGEMPTLTIVRRTELNR